MHYSVMLSEAIEGLNIKENGTYVDCTLGYAGHSSEILKRINKGFLFAFDQDMEAINSSKQKLDKIGNNYHIFYSNFVNMKDKLKEKNIDKVDGILFDLGVSSPQLDEDSRGFSFHNDSTLDMRMDTSASLTAKQVVNTYSKEELIDIFFKYGEEKYARSIAEGIVKYRTTKEIETTLELVDIIKDNVPDKYKREKHPARKVFQALRIEVNNELEVFERALKDALGLLSPNGRICVITFHSLEDRICKNIFSEVTKIDDTLKKLPVIPEEYLPDFKIVKVLEPSKEELERNNRARSAKLRVIEKIK